MTTHPTKQAPHESTPPTLIPNEHDPSHTIPGITAGPLRGTDSKSEFLPVMKGSPKILIALALTFAILIMFCIWDRELKFLMLWAIHLVPTAVIGVPLWYFNRHRVSWGTFDFLIITVPFIVYLLAALMLDREKGLGNLAEPFVLGFFLPLAPLTRAVAGPNVRAATLAACSLALLCLLAIALYAFVPCTE